MPSGVPVACMSIGKTGAKNASILALEILGITDKNIKEKFIAYKNRMGKQIKKIKLNL